MTAAAQGAPVIQPQPLDVAAITETLRGLIATREAKKKIAAKMTAAEAREREQCELIAQLCRASAAGVVVDGYALTIHCAPGHPPLVHLRPVVVL